MNKKLSFLFVAIAMALTACSSCSSSSSSVAPDDEELSSSSKMDSAVDEPSIFSSSAVKVESSSSAANSSNKFSSSSKKESSADEPSISSSSTGKVESSSSADGSTTEGKTWEYLNPDIDYGTFTDSRDGQVYKTVKIGNQLWMAENLNFDSENSWCYEDKTENCKKLGRLYTWDAAKEACPEAEGWRLPIDSELESLVSLDKSLLAKGFKKWPRATNESGFSAVPSGNRTANGDYRYSDDFSILWSATDKGDEAHNLFVSGTDIHLDKTGSGKEYGNAVRCIKK